MEKVMYSVVEKKYPVVEYAKDMYVYDTEGRKYLDCAAGIAVANIGHGVEDVINEIYSQAKKATFVYGGTFTSNARQKLANQIIDMAPKGMDKVFFCSGGSEAMESVIKIARQYHLECGNTGKYKIISRWQSYHGNTITTLSVGGRPSWRKKYEPYFNEMPHISQCNCYRCPYGMKKESCNIMCAKELERIIKFEGPETVAAFIIEPIIGTTAAATMPPVEYIKEIRDICDKYNVLLCYDEVITGFGRTGKNFAADHFGVVPDLIGVAKGLGSGYMPIGGVIIHKKIVDAIINGSGELAHSFTFAGNPLACAAASKVLEYMNNNNLVENSRLMGEYFLEKLKELEALPCVGEVRGVGLMLAVEFVKDKKTKAPFKADVKFSGRVAGYCFERGLMVTAGVAGSADGIDGEAMQIAPPYIITKEQIDFAVSLLKEAIEYTYNQIQE